MNGRSLFSRMNRIALFGQDIGDIAFDVAAPSVNIQHRIVPFADHSCAVSVLLQDRREDRQALPERDEVVDNAVRMHVLTGENRSSASTAMWSPTSCGTARRRRPADPCWMPSPRGGPCSSSCRNGDHRRASGPACASYGLARAAPASAVTAVRRLANSRAYHISYKKPGYRVSLAPGTLCATEYICSPRSSVGKLFFSRNPLTHRYAS